MVPIYLARGPADGRHRALPAEAERRRLIAAVARWPAALAPRASGSLAI
jgi:hypothetical protein